MQSGFTHTLSEMKRLPGTSPAEVQAARNSAEELVVFASRQLALIKQFTELREIVTTADAVRIRDALAAIRQVAAALKKLAFAHRNGPLVDAFGIPYLKVEEWHRRAEKQSAVLLVLLPP